jgi:hypothetical protein
LNHIDSFCLYAKRMAFFWTSAVVAGIGTEPTIELAKAISLTTENGVIVQRGAAELSLNNPALGEHTVALTNPAGCFPPALPSCD